MQVPGVRYGYPQYRSDFLEILRRDLLRRASWSSGVYDFCNSQLPEAANTGYEQALVRQFCAQLPRTLDIACDNDACHNNLASDFSRAVWGDSHFSLTLDTALTKPDIVYATEKAFKPIVAWRPLVLLGAPHALAWLRTLGFHTFSAVVNESYDEIVHPVERTRAVIDEVERLSTLNGSEWVPAARAIAHNAKHAACGGFSAALQARARELFWVVMRAARAQRE